MNEAMPGREVRSVSRTNDNLLTSESSAVHSRQIAFDGLLSNKHSKTTKLKMKIKNLMCSLLAAAPLAGLTACVSESAKEANLEAQAKITKADAEKTALAKVPNGTVKEAEIEQEKGKLIWSFDLATPGTKDITEVEVDAITGKIASVETE